MLRAVLFFLVALGLTACGEIPKDSLKTYSESFQTAHAASEDFLVQFGQTQKSAREFIAANSEPSDELFRPYPDTLPATPRNGEAVDPAVEAMRLGFDVISHYNATLVALADGKGPEEVGAAVSGLVGALSNFVPAAGVASAAVGTLATELERARLRREFSAALEKGAPIVRDILRIVADNVDTGYSNNVVLADRSRALLVFDILERVRELQALMRGHSAPPAGSRTFTELPDRQEALDALLSPIARETGVASQFPFQLTFTAGAAPYSSGAESAINRLIETISGQIKQYDAILARVTALAQSGSAYKQLLNLTMQSLTALENADATPPDLTRQASELLRLAFVIKTHVEEIRAASAN